MKRMIYQVAVGKPSKLYKHCIASCAAYCELHGIAHIVQKQPILWIKPDPFNTGRSAECCARLLPMPIYEKENAFAYFDRYDQIAIIDADIFIRPGSPNIFDWIADDMDFAGCVERDMPITNKYMSKIDNYSNMQYRNLKDVEWNWEPQRGADFMNMGLMVMNKSFAKYLKGQTPAQFIARPEFKDFVDGKGTWKWSSDQTLLNWWIRKEKMKVQKLPWRYNALYTSILEERLPEAHFIHFFLKDKLLDGGENIEDLMRKIGE